MTIDTAVLADLEAGRIHLDRGGHPDRSHGHCAMEVVAWLAGEGHTDAPHCASPVLTAYTIRLNDRWSDEQRQALAPYLPRMVGTRGDGLDDARLEIARQALTRDLLPPWLRLAGMDAEADAISTVNLADLRSMLESIRAAAWKRRNAALEPIQEKVRAAVREKLAQHPAAVAVAADAVTAAAAAVAAAAAAAVVAAVAAVADAVVAVAADAVTAAAAAAVAAVAAVADAVADAVVAAADAVVAAAAADASWASTYWPAYEAVKPIFLTALEDGTAPKLVAVRELAAAQRGMALDLLDRMIKPEVAQ